MRTIEQNGRILWVIGSPISHTFSPQLHNSAFRSAKLPHRYFAMEVEDTELERFVEIFRDVDALGANLTLPLKNSIREYVKQESDAVKSTGAANTLFWDQNKLSLENTDVHGFKKLIEPWNKQLRERPPLLLGAGGAARACLQALIELNISEVYLWNRTRKKADKLSKQFSPLEIEVLSRKELESGDFEANVVVNATSLGVNSDDPSPFPEDRVHSGMIGIDLNYGKQTKFLKNFSEHGTAAEDGLTMLIEQAARSWELWVGYAPDKSAMKNSVSG